jgi:hypothetical protein
MCCISVVSATGGSIVARFEHAALSSGPKMLQGAAAVLGHCKNVTLHTSVKFKYNVSVPSLLLTLVVLLPVVPI